MRECLSGPEQGGRCIECSKCEASTVLLFASKIHVMPVLADKWNQRTPKPPPKKSKRQFEWEAYIDELDGVE